MVSRTADAVPEPPQPADAALGDGSRTETSLAAALRRGNNNFDLLRLIAALMVISGHSRALTATPTGKDWIQPLIGFDYSGSLAVDFFFFLSGLLVTNSFISSPVVLRFAVHRFLRIFPGLLVCLLITVLVMGPYFTTIPIGAYFRQPDTWSYLTHNLAMIDLRWTIPHVLDGARHGLNGSIWTLPPEVLCYLYVMGLGGLGLLRVRWLSTAVLIGVVALSFWWQGQLPQLFQDPQLHVAPACFALGALAAIYRASIPLGWQPAVALWVLYAIGSNPALHQLLFYAALFYTCVWLSSMPLIVKRLHLPFDASYGTYIYAFPVQQSLYALWPRMSDTTNMLAAGVVATLLGIGSWYGVEKPAMRWGRRLLSPER